MRHTRSDRRRPGSRHRVVVIGAGFGGLAVARSLRRTPFEVVLVDANNFHTFQPLLYQVATAGLDADDVAHAARSIVRGARNTEMLMARVVGMDLDRRCLRIHHGEGERELAYDTLVIAAGAISASFGVPGVDEHAFPLKSLEHALDLRAHVLDRFERAALDPSLVDDGSLDVVICGGGPTGVEMAGGLMELYEKVLDRDFPSLPVRRARVILVEMADRLLLPFSPESSERARRTLSRRGVEVRLGVGVASAEPTRVTLTDGTVIPAHTLVWAAGVTASPLAQMTGTPIGRAGRLVVEDDLSLPGHPEVFAIGDIAAATGGGDAVLPQVAQPAIQGGRDVARRLVARIHGDDIGPFTYVDKGSMATIGRHDAVAELPNGIRLHGPIGWVAWLALHLVYLMGFRNRANVLVNWAWNYVTYDHGSRILAESDTDRQVPRQRERRRRDQLSA